MGVDLKAPNRNVRVVLSRPFMQRREMAHSVPTKAFPQPATTATMCMVSCA